MIRVFFAIISFSLTDVNKDETECSECGSKNTHH